MEPRPSIPLEEVLLGVVPVYEAEARSHIRRWAAEVVATFVPEAGDDPIDGGGGDPAATKEESNSGQ